jgi:hypothetical protein
MRRNEHGFRQGSLPLVGKSHQVVATGAIAMQQDDEAACRPAFRL